MVGTHKLIFKLLLLGVTVAGIVSLFQASVAQAAFEAKYEWVNNSTVRATFNTGNEDKTVDLKYDAEGPRYTASGVTYKPTVGGTSLTPITCEYEINLFPAGTDKSKGQIDNLRTSSNTVSECPDQLVNNGAVSVGAAANAELTPADTGEEGEQASSCHIDGIGWLLCPVMYFFGLITDEAKNLVESLLKTQPLNVVINSENDNPTYEAWAMMRNFANVAFVIGFLFIIFSQVTSIGISNYGVKKLLPRLVIAGILVNVSYWICAIALDITNILGSSVSNAMYELTNNFMTGSKEAEVSKKLGVDTMNGGTNNFSTVIGSVIGIGVVAGAVSFLHVSVLFPLLITALAAIVTVAVVLTIRQALIIVLVVVSPLAFVAFLLPNTENLFSKWKSIFTTMLIMYPAVALIFGVSAFASKVIMYSAPDKTVAIVGMFVAVIPLFITPVVMKTAGGFLNRIGGIVNNTDKGAFDYLRNKSAKYREGARAEQRDKRLGAGNSMMNKEFGPAGSRRRKAANLAFGGANSRRRGMLAAARSGGATSSAEFDKKIANQKGGAEYAEAKYLADRAVNDKDFALRMAGGDKDKAAALRASSLSTLKKLDAEDVNNRITLMKQENDPKVLPDKAQAAYEEAVRTNDAVGAHAAQDILLHSGDRGLANLQTAIEHLERDPAMEARLQDTSSGSLGSSLRRNLNEAGLKGSNNVLNKWAHEGKKITDLEGSTTVFSGLNPQQLAGQSEKNIDAAIKTGAISSTQAQAVMGNPNVLSSLTPEKRRLFEAHAQSGPATAGPATGTSGPTAGGGSPAGGTGGGSPNQGGGGQQPHTPPTATAPPQSPQPQPAAQPSPQQQAANNAGMRTSPNVPGTNGWAPNANGLHIPPGAAAPAPTGAATATATAAGAAGAAMAGNNRPAPQATPTVTVQAPQTTTQQYPQQQQQQTMQANVPPVVVNTPAPQMATPTFTAPAAAPTVIPGGGGTANFGTPAAGPQTTINNINNTNAVQQDYHTVLNQAGGDMSKISMKDLGRLIDTSHNDSGSQGIHNELRKEYGRRRGYDGPAGPMPPSSPPSGPPNL